MADPFAAAPPLLDDDAEADDGAPWPTCHQLASLWEENHVVRKNLRLTGKMIVWPKVELTGVATLQALSANRIPIADAITVWGSHHNQAAKPPPIEWLKQEAWVNLRWGTMLKV